MAAFRVVKAPFICAGALYGPGRYSWANVYDEWRLAHSEPSDDASIPPGHVEIIQADGIACAYDRLATWTRNN
jgi:hypothetical protein